jgi:hypothetical protein
MKRLLGIVWRAWSSLRELDDRTALRQRTIPPTK